MRRLATPFDARSAQVGESSAAGGSTTTTCSCCVVTLGATSVLTAMYFSKLGRQGDELQRQRSAAIAPAPDGSVDTAIEMPLPSPPGPPWGLLGFFLLPLAFLASGIAFGAAGIGGLVLTPLFVVGIWLFGHVKLQRHVGRSTGSGIGVGLASLLGIGVAVAIEAAAWLSALN